MGLTRNRAHDFSSDERPVECRRCGFVLRPGQEKRDLCSGLNQRSGGLQRTPLKQVSDSNSGREHQKDEDFRAYVRELPCLVCGDPPPNSACHVKNWGAGWGDWVDGEGNMYPGCVDHHREEENAIGGGPETFQAEHGIDLEEEAKRIGREYRDRAQLREGESE